MDRHQYENLVFSNPEEFQTGFPGWLKRNEHLLFAFMYEALRAARVYNHYSARTIVHWLRHETAMREVGSEFKINNDWSPDLSRLFELAYPEYVGFFEMRERKVRTVADTLRDWEHLLQ